MRSPDSIYQAAVDQEANKLLKLSMEEILRIEDYGTIQTTINNNPGSIAFWHWKLNGHLHHIIFITERRFCLIFHKKYSSGIKVDHGRILKLTDKEIGSYD